MPTELSVEQSNLADAIWISGAFKVGAFRLKIHEKNPDAPLSPYYVSMRERDVLPETFPDLCDSIARAINADAEKASKAANVVIGIPKAGDPIAAALSSINGLPQLYMDKYEGEDERHITNRVRGNFVVGMRVLGVDDLITAADTKFEFKEGLEVNGLKLVHLGVALDREQGGMQKLRDAGVSVSSAIRISELLDYYLSDNRLSQVTYDQIRSYIASQ